MEKKKEVKGRSTKSKVMTVMLGVALFCILSLLLLAILDKGEIFGREANPSGGEPKNEVKYVSYVDYLLDQKVVKAELYRLKDKEFKDTEDYEKTITLTPEQYKDLLIKTRGMTLVKGWYQLDVSNGEVEGPAYKLTIVYEKDGKEYTFELIDFYSIDTDKLDEEFKNVLDNTYDHKSDLFVSENPANEAVFYYFEQNYPYAYADKYFK